MMDGQKDLLQRTVVVLERLKLQRISLPTLHISAIFKTTSIYVIFNGQENHKKKTHRPSFNKSISIIYTVAFHPFLPVIVGMCQGLNEGCFLSHPCPATCPPTSPPNTTDNPVPWECHLLSLQLTGLKGQKGNCQKVQH